MLPCQHIEYLWNYSLNIISLWPYIFLYARYVATTNESCMWTCITDVVSCDSCTAHNSSGCQVEHCFLYWKMK